MAERKIDRIGPKLSIIGEHVANMLPGDPDRIYLYVEVGDRWISVNVFRDEGDVVRNYPSVPQLNELLWDVWKLENDNPKKRWSVMEYEIRNGKFDAQFAYPDQVDVESYDTDRRAAALKKHFGDKPVIYPPMPHID